MSYPRVSIIILTKNAGNSFAETLKLIYAQEYPGRFEVTIIDSGSNDVTINIVRSYPARLFCIKAEDFGHGKTRNLGAKLAEGDCLVFITQDAIPASNKWLLSLVRNLEESQVAGAYGRQIPKLGVKPMERCFLNAKYPPNRVVKYQEQGEIDMNAIFFSNANSAIGKEIWQRYPFDDNLIMSEDWEWAKKVLLAGYKIVYDPEAAVYHSHNYNLKTVFQRYFDSGVSFSHFAGKECGFGNFTSEGLAYTKNEMKFLITNGYMKWLPYAVLYDLAKFFGVSLGRKEKYLPLGLKKRLSLHSYYWIKLGKA